MKKSRANLEALLEESLISYYYAGFILADGHIEKGKRLQMSLSVKDFDFLQKMAEYLGVKNLKKRRYFIKNKEVEVASFSAQDIEAIRKFSNKFGIVSDKTHCPPDVEIFENLSKEKLLSMIIGFIDGDGSIRKIYKRKDANIAVKCHSSWLPILEFFSNAVCGKNLAKINSHGYASVIFSRFSDIKHLKIFALENNLPIMMRKWENIEESQKNRTDIHKERLEKIREMASNGYTINEICEVIGAKYTCVYNIIKRNKINYLPNGKERKQNNVSD